MRRMICAVIAPSLLVVLSLAAQGTGRIEGAVRAAAGNPLGGARVLISGTAVMSTTDAQGHYSIDAIPAGVVQVEARAIGYQPRAVAGVRVWPDKTIPLDFKMDRAEVTMVELSPAAAAARRGAPSLLLRFQLIRPSATRTTDRLLMPIDSVLRDLFQWPGYQLLAQSALTLDMPMGIEWGGTGAGASTETMLNVEGRSYELSVRVDTASPPRVRMTVALVGLSQQPAPKSVVTTQQERKTLFTTTVTVGLGHTVVLGSTQPGGGRGGMAGTLILTVSPAMRPPN